MLGFVIGYFKFGSLGGGVRVRMIKCWFYNIGFICSNGWQLVHVWTALTKLNGNPVEDTIWPALLCKVQVNCNRLASDIFWLATEYVWNYQVDLKGHYSGAWWELKCKHNLEGENMLMSSDFNGCMQLYVATCRSWTLVYLCSI